MSNKNATSSNEKVVLQKRPKLAPILTGSSGSGYGTVTTAPPSAAAAARIGTPTSAGATSATAAFPASAAIAALNDAAIAEATARRDDALFRDSIGASPTRLTSRRGVQFMSHVEQKFTQSAAARRGSSLAEQIAKYEQQNRPDPIVVDDEEDADNDGGLSTRSNAGSPAAVPFSGSAPTGTSLSITPSRPPGISSQSRSRSPGAGGAPLARGHSFTARSRHNSGGGGGQQFRVVSVGRRTYIQSISDGANALAAARHRGGGATPTSSGSAQQQHNGGNFPGGDASAAAREAAGTPVSPPPAAVAVAGSVVEVIHSVDEPIDNISFFSGGQDFFLPRPQPVVSTARDQEGDEGGSDNGDARSALPSSGGSHSQFEGFEHSGGDGSGGGRGGDPDGDGDDNSTAPEGDAASSKKVSLSEIFSGSKNVPRMFAYNLIDGACFGLWSSSVLPAFMFIIAGRDNSFVGFNAAVQGGCQMTCAILAAYLGDKRILLKYMLLRIATLFGLAAIAVTVYAVYSESKAWFWPSSALWGCYIGFANPSSESVFADSVPGGQRVAVYTYKWILQLLSYLFGYVTTVIMFEHFGDTWAVGEMRPVLYAGLFAHVLSMISLWTLHDDHTLEVHKVKESTTTTSSAGAMASSTSSSKKSIKSASHAHDHNHDHNHHEADDCDKPDDCGHDHESCTLCQQSRKIRIRIVSLAKCKKERCRDKCICAPTVVAATAAAAAGDQDSSVGGGGSSSNGTNSKSRFAPVGSIQRGGDDDGRASNVSLPTMAGLKKEAVRDDGRQGGRGSSACGDGGGGEGDESDEVLSIADSEDRLLIEELEDDAKREKTGDPLISDLCQCCFDSSTGRCCCSSCCGQDDEHRQQQQQQHDVSVSGPLSSDEEDEDAIATAAAATLSPKEAEKQQLLPKQVVPRNRKTSSRSRQQQQQSLKNQPICSKMSLVPLLIVTADIMQAIGGGITVRFFPLFFLSDLGVTPVELAVVSIILCIFAALLSHFLKKFSSGISRTHLIVVIRLLGSGLMFLMEFASGAVGGKYPMLAYFVLRSALLNSMMGLSRSIIMDFCRKRHRTLFSAMESVSTLSFSGSAAVGGVIADKHGYRSTFGVTAAFYVAAAFFVAPAGIYVDRDLAKKKEEKKLKTQ